MASNIRIIRGKHDKDNPYFVASRDVAQNENLSWEARGLLMYLLSKPDDWEVVPKDLEQQCSKSKVYRIIGELKDAGYLHREKHRNEKGQWIWTPYMVYEKPYTEKPDTVNPDTEKPYTEKPEIIQNTDVQSTEKQSTDIQDTSFAGAKTDDSKPEKKKPAKKPRKAKKDTIPQPTLTAMKDAIAEVFGYEKDTTTDSEWAMINKVATQLCRVNLDASEIKPFYAYCKKRFDNFTPQALAKHVTAYRQTKATPGHTPYPKLVEEQKPTRPVNPELDQMRRHLEETERKLAMPGIMPGFKPLLENTRDSLIAQIRAMESEAA